MYIRGLIPRNSTELSEAVPIALQGGAFLWTLLCFTLNQDFLRRGCTIESLLHKKA